MALLCVVPQKPRKSERKLLVVESVDLLSREEQVKCNLVASVLRKWDCQNHHDTEQLTELGFHLALHIFSSSALIVHYDSYIVLTRWQMDNVESN